MTAPENGAPGGRELLAPAFPDDDGAADPVLAGALLAAARGVGGRGEALLALQEARVLVPVVAVATETEVDEAGLARDKSSDMAAVLLRGADGRLALLAFTSLAAMAAWDPAARPVPVAATTAAQAAVQDDAAALLLDVAGPARLVVEGEDLRALAAGWRLTRLDGGFGWVGPASAD